MSALTVDFGQLADIHIVYRMYDSGGRLLYVGVTGHIGKRFRDHWEKAWFLAVTSITLERYPNYAEAAMAEDRAIAAERPLHNQVGLSGEESRRRARARRAERSLDKMRIAEEKRQQAEEEKR